jgi:peptide/nickel transport system permease protein
MSVGASELLREPGGFDEPRGTPAAGRSPLSLFWGRLRGDRAALAALIAIVLLVLVAIFAPLVVALFGAPGPNAVDPNAMDAFGAPKGPGAGALFGYDSLGRDVFSRTVYGARVSLLVGVGGTAIAVVLGVVVGLLAGFYRGWVDTLLSRFVDVLLSFPILLLALGIASACSLGKGCAGGAIKPGLGTVLLVVAIINWTYIARIVRGQVLSLRERDFVAAARVSGASDATIVFREILPNLIAPVIVYATLLVPQNILLEAALSFLGVGITPPTASWGAMISDAAQNFDTQWWYMVFPGAALVLTVLSFNLLGDGLHDALDPKRDR